MDLEIKREKLEGFEFWKKTLKSAKYVVAPMVDQSELAWRMFSRKYGAELCYSPMYHASVFVRDEKYRKEALLTCEEDRPLIVQFCANDPDTLLKAGKLAESHCDAIDLNLGCPQLIAKKGHYGAFLMDEWDLLQKIVKTCHENLNVPITCKIRVFDSIEKTILYAQMLEKAGCQLLTVHGRQKEQKGKSTGVANWEHIKAVKANVSIPVFANGNIQYLSDVTRCLEETNVDGVMSAEGNLHNPALFTGICPPVWQMAEEYLEFAVQYPCPMSYIRGHLFKLCHHALCMFPDMRQLIGNGKSIDCFKLAVLKLKEKCLTAEAEYKKNAELFKSDLKFPFWICQPYVRPGPNETVEQSQEKIAIKERLKRHLEITKSVLQNGEDISKNKLKKLIKHPNKIFDKSERSQKYFKCETCGNPKGGKCKFGLCKHCCRKKTLAETLDCVGHRLMFRTKVIRKVQWEEQQARLATFGDIDVKAHSFAEDMTLQTQKDECAGSFTNVSEEQSHGSCAANIEEEFSSSRNVIADEGTEEKQSAENR